MQKSFTIDVTKLLWNHYKIPMIDLWDNSIYLLMYAGYGPALSFLSDESAICAHIVEKEYGGLRMKTPDVEFKVGSHLRARLKGGP